MNEEQPMQGALMSMMGAQANPDQAGDQTQNPGQQKTEVSEYEKLIKALLPATSNAFHPEIRNKAKSLMEALIPYL